jgi:hypothetical protein
MEMPQKIKNRTMTGSCNPISGNTVDRVEIRILKKHLQSLMFMKYYS